jgi:hypothetical protein
MEDCATFRRPEAYLARTNDFIHRAMSIMAKRKMGRTAEKFSDPRVVCGVVTRILYNEDALWDAARLNNRVYNKAVELNRKEKRCLELLYRRHCSRLREITTLVSPGIGSPGH